MKSSFFTRILPLVFGVLCLIYYWCIISLLGVRKDFSLLWLFAGAACILYAFLSGTEAVRKFFDILPRPLLAAIAVFVLVCGTVFILLFGMVIGGSRKTAGSGADYCIVLGAKTRSDHIPYILYYRLIAACEYHKKSPDTVFVVSGGQGSDEDATEASVMKRFLIEHGVPESKIIEEDRSTDTDENLDFSYELIKENHEKKGAAGDPEIVICTTDFHLFRALCLARAKKLPVSGGIAAKGRLSLEFHYSVRECVGLVKELAVGNIKTNDLLQ